MLTPKKAIGEGEIRRDLFLNLLEHGRKGNELRRAYGTTSVKR
jgi:hypothetical protein